ncbi:MAG: glycosyltransferase family 2 protein [Longimicrobiales bacterium]|nr:glycosyltransferase family 2 protein [Longimicrobiales bacterium]
MQTTGRSPGPTLSIVIPCHNEEECVTPLVHRLTTVLEEIGDPFELIFVDDGSQDGTLDRLRASRAADPRVKYVSLSRNFGHEAASTAGLRHAAGGAVVLMDADLQDPPEVIPELVKRWKEGFELVFATRDGREGERLFKRTTSALFYRLMGKVVKFDFPANTGDFRLMSRAVVDGFLLMPERNRFVRGMVAWTGFRTTSVLYRRARRHSGETKYNVGKLVVLALDAITGFSAVPIRLVSLVGLGVTAVSALGTLWIVFNKLFLGIDIPGYAFLAAGVLFLGGVQILMLGAIGEYVGRIYVETQRRPLYLVRELAGLTGERIDGEHRGDRRL